MEEKKEVKKPVLEDDKAKKVLDVLDAVEKIYEVQSKDSMVAKAIES